MVHFYSALTVHFCTALDTTMDYARDYIHEILATHTPEPLPAEALPKIAAIIQRARARVHVAA